MSVPPPSYALTFSQGELTGGATLWSEPLKDLRSRQRDVTAVRWFFLGAFVFMAIVAINWGMEGLRSHPGETEWLFFILIGAVWLPLGILMFRAGSKIAEDITPRKVCVGGFSMGNGLSPFLPKASLYSIEEQARTRGRDPRTAVLTWEGGYNIRITSSTLTGMGRPARYFPDLVPLLAALRKMEGVPRIRSDLWSEAAWEMTGSLRLDRGPVQAIAESLAGSTGSARIDEGFLADNWNQIKQAYAPAYLPPFKQVSKLAARYLAQK